MELGKKPTPVVRKGRLWVKRDDLLSPVYGGNKVRKLERLLDVAKAKGATKLVTLGAAGSHHVLATSIFGREHGFLVEAVLVPQPGTDHARNNLRAALAHGLRAFTAPAWLAAPLVIATRMRPKTFLVPLGGSNVEGTLGYVDAAKELKDQVEAGVLPDPDVIVVAVGSGGTAAGLAVGLEMYGMRARIVGVVVSPPVGLVSAMTRRLVRATGRRAGLSRDQVVHAIARIEVEPRFLGRGYGYPTVESTAALAAAREHDLELDAIYTAKAYACALTRREENVVFWHTLSTANLPSSGAELPPRLARLFT